MLRRPEFLRAAAAVAASTTAEPVLAQIAPATVRVGVVTTDSYGEAYYGDDAGIFKANGLILDIRPLANSGAIAGAIAGGSLDVGMGSPSQVAAAIENGAPFAFFAPGALFIAEAPTTILMVAKTSPIKNATDLDGKTIATENLRSIPQLTVDEWMQKDGGDPASIKWIELPVFSMAAALEAGRIDAAVISEPAIGPAREKNRMLASPFESLGRRWCVSAWFSTRTWLDANGSTARRLTTAISQAAVYANSHQAETAASLLRFAKLTPDVIPSLTRVRFEEHKLEPSLLQPILDLAFKHNLLPRTIAARDIMYP